MAVNRDRVITRTSLIGIAANVLLALFKAVIGVLSHSIAVILDAVNNFSDALSSVITILGAKFANRRPDHKHPLGHGRAEYVSALLVAGIVLATGIRSAYESVMKIINPEIPDYSLLSLVFIGVAVVVKIVLGRYFIRQGKKAASSALEASGSDAFFDAVLSLSVFSSAVLFRMTGISIEAWIGVVISVFIIRSGVQIASKTMDDILGRRADLETVKTIKQLINEEPEVQGAYDLIINNYGPEKNYASVHIELPDTMTVREADAITRRLQKKVYLGTGVILTGVGVYSYNTCNDEAARIRNRVRKIVLNHDWALQIHGFYADTEKKVMQFDVVFSFDFDPAEGRRIIKEDINKEYPDYRLRITSDVDIS